MFRPEYEIFPLDVFQAHIYQEARSELETPYHRMNKKMKGLKRDAELKATLDEEDDIDFFESV